VTRKTAVVIGSGIGGLALGIRLQSLGFDTTIVEKLNTPGGRANVRSAHGFLFDMGPTVITVPHFIEELFALERGRADLGGADFPPAVLRAKRSTSGISGGPNTSKYVTLVPILPFYRIYFDGASHGPGQAPFFDYDGDHERMLAQIRALAPEDVDGYARFQAAARAIFERGFLQLGYTHFGDLGTFLRAVPDLMRLDAVRPLFSFTSKYFKSPLLRQVFSFEPLLIGGNPLRVPAIYAMIHLVEQTWGIHFPMGGTGALVRALARKFEDLGGAIRYQAEVTRIDVTDGNGRSPGRPFARRFARGVTLADGEKLQSDLVASNGDYANTYMKLVEPRYRVVNSDLRVKRARQSMSLVVVYFGFRADGLNLALCHHNIILGPRYEGLLTDIFDRGILPDDFSLYLHIPTLTDPSLAPPGHHAAYALVPVPNNASKLNWATLGEPLVDKVLRFIERRGYVPGLCDRLVYKSFITPDYFEHTLNSWLGNGFGLEPTLTQSAYFRPHNRSEDIRNLYLVGASTQPGGGIPAVMMSAKMTARLIAADFAIAPEITSLPHR
jgi:phytoene desaturase